MSARSFMLAALTLGCATVPGPLQAAASHSADLPPATGPLHVPATDADASLQDLLVQFGELTGQRLLMDEPTRSLVQSTRIELGTAADVPAAEVYSFVESLLAFNGMFVTEIKGGKVPILGIHSATTRMQGRPSRKSIAAEDLPAYRDHPALLIQTVIQLENLDVRQPTSLRAMLTDTNTQILLPIGATGLLLGGTGRHIADLAQLLGEMNRQEGAANRSGEKGVTDAATDGNAENR